MWRIEEGKEGKEEKVRGNKGKNRGEERGEMVDVAGKEKERKIDII